MGRVNVYYFRKYDIISDTTVHSKRPATLEAIGRSGGEALLDTVQEVDEAALDDEGFLRQEIAPTRP